MKNTEDFKGMMDLATVRLYKGIDKSLTPDDARNGFLVQRGKRTIVITAAHEMELDDHWFVDMNINKGHSSVHAPLNGLMRWWRADLSTDKDPEELDIAWADLDMSAFSKLLLAEGWDPKEPLPIYPYIGPIETPKEDTLYGFHALSKVDIDANLRLVFPIFATEVDLRYTHVDPIKDVYVFDMAREHQGHPYYKGASGCPIANEEGQIVSILLGGNSEENILWGAKLTDYDRMWDTEFKVPEPSVDPK